METTAAGARTRAISIWFFVGVLLAVYGVLIFVAGLYNWRHPPEDPGTALFRFRTAGIWWGLLLLAAGSFYAVRFRPRREEGPGGTPPAAAGPEVPAEPGRRRARP